MSVVSNQASQGRVGLTVVLPFGQAFAAGTRQIAACTFAIASQPPGNSTWIGFGDQPVARQVKDALANLLTAEYQPGSLALNSALRVSLGVTHGVLTLSRTVGLAFTAGDGTQDGSLELTGSLSDLNAALENLTYLGAPNYEGPDTLRMVANDLGNTGSGGSLAATNTVAITIAGVSDAPVITAQPQSQMVVVETNVSFSVTAVGLEPLGYQWRKGGTSIAGATQATLVLSNVSTNDSGAYSVVVSNTDGAVTSQEASLMVLINSSRSLRLAAGSGGGAKGAQALVPVQVWGFTNVVGLQFSMHWATNVALFQGVENFGLEGLTSVSFGMAEATNGTMRVSWDDTASVGKTLGDGTTIFSLRFELVGNAGDTSALTLDGAPIPVEGAVAVGGEVQAVTVEAEFGQLSVRTGVRLAGAVKYYTAEREVPGVTLGLSGDGTEQTATGSDGQFSLTAMPGGDYSLTPSGGWRIPPAKG